MWESEETTLHGAKTNRAGRSGTVPVYLLGPWLPLLPFLLLSLARLRSKMGRVRFVACWRGWNVVVGELVFQACADSVCLL